MHPNAGKLFPVDDLTRARRDYVTFNAQKIDLDMKIIANKAEAKRLDVQHSAASDAALKARDMIEELENRPAKSADMPAAAVIAVGSGLTPKAETPSE